jgi:MFS family permease
LCFAGKLGASSGFVLAYMLPAQIFPIHKRGLAIGVANIFARCGSILAPLCGSAPPVLVQTGLGTMALTICALAMVALPDLRAHATGAD